MEPEKPSTADRILEILRRSDGPVPGPQIARKVNISRAAVWKHVHRLIDRGYGIASAKPGGYQLQETPDRLLAAEIYPLLTTRRIGRVIHHFETIDSTNRRAMELARSGAAEGEVVLAEAQTKGRGRLGRSFFSPPNVSLYASLILRPRIPPALAPQITLVAGLAVAMAVERHGAVRPGLKWPNDVLLGSLKVAGILTEMESEADRVLHVICGPGVNLNVPAGAFPPELRHRAAGRPPRLRRRLLRELRATLRRIPEERLPDAAQAVGIVFGPERPSRHGRGNGRARGGQGDRSR
jgi:BirA family biotin operon repressor/biotin-[acetyl-CoA-carboxylase] ligase